METSGRFAKYKVHVPDQPGGLAKILELIAAQGANVVQLDHHREGFGLPFGWVEIEVSVETRDQEHASSLAAKLDKYLA
ncbi:MAG: ACT domain-containing protein [Actinomycetota bacterium]|nr:ACT domain-containing protein [Actinomycetota bacterium]